MAEVIDVREALTRMGYTYTESSSHFHMRPLYRESDNNLALEVDKRTGLWYDFVERTGGPFTKLIELTMKLSPDKVAEFLQDKTLSVTIKDKYELGEVKRFDKALLQKLTKDHAYWQSRGISLETISLFGGGTTNNGRMKNRYVFPILNMQEDLLGFSGRNLGSYGPKWKHIGAKNSWCYPLRWNHAILSKMREVILLESIGDMLALWEAGIKNTLVTFGISISPTIIQYLLRIDAQRVLLAFNNDVDNKGVGNEAAVKGRLHLMQYFDAHQVIVALPEQKDFGAMHKEQIDVWKRKFLSSPS